MMDSMTKKELDCVE